MGPEGAEMLSPLGASRVTCSQWDSLTPVSGCHFSMSSSCFWHPIFSDFCSSTTGVFEGCNPGPVLFSLPCYLCPAFDYHIFSFQRSSHALPQPSPILAGILSDVSQAPLTQRAKPELLIPQTRSPSSVAQPWGMPSSAQLWMPSLIICIPRHND